MLKFLDKTEPPKTDARQRTLDALNSDATGRRSEDELHDFLRGISAKINMDIDREEKVRIESMVTMCRRHRGATPSDLFGIFRSNQWLEHDSFADLHGTNIFQSLVRGAEANYSGAKIKLDIRCRGNHFEARSAERVAKGIYEVINETIWDEEFDAAIFYAAILKLNAFLITRFNRDKGQKLRVPVHDEVAFEEGGLYICTSCDQAGTYMSDTEKCENPECGNETLMVLDGPSEQSQEVVSGYKDIKGGCTETIVADGFDCRFDDTHGNCASIRDAEWFEYHYLVPKQELLNLYPHLSKALQAHPDWSYPTQWKQALKRFHNGAVRPTGEFEAMEYEMREIWLKPNRYRDYVAPKDAKIGAFTIKAGESLIDYFPDGLVYGICNGEPAFIDSEVLHDTVATCVWLADPVSGWGLGARAGLPLQKKINHLDNINMEGVSRALRGAIVYDPQAINGAYLEGANTNIPLRPDFERNGQKIGDFFETLNVSGLSADVMAFLQQQHDLIQKVMGVPDAAIGETDPNNKTAAGQMLLAQRATGLLIPAKKSQAKAKEDWLLHHLKLIQQYYPVEYIQKVFGLRYKDDWVDEEVEAFLQADLDEMITIEYVEGSEIPQSRAEKEAKLFGMIQAGVIPPTPQNMAKLIVQSGIDGVDVGNYESNIKVAKKRFQFLKDGINQNKELFDLQFEIFEQELTDPVTGQRMVGEGAQPIPNPLVLQFLYMKPMRIVQEAEDHVIMMEWWQERIRELIGSVADQSTLLIECCRQMIREHRLSAIMEGAAASTAAGLTQAPLQMQDKMVGDANLSSPQPAEQGRDGSGGSRAIETQPRENVRAGN